MDCEVQLTPCQIDHFLKNCLKIEDWKYILEKSKFDLMKRVIESHVVHVPFQNLDIAATEKSKRKIPTVQDIIKWSLSGKGGVCFQVNYFLKILFQSLGYEAFCISGTYTGSQNKGSHLMTVVKGNSGNELYLLDCGSAQVVHEPIPLHNLPVTGKAGGFRYEYRKLSDTQYGRIQFGGSLFHGPYSEPGKTEEIRFYFDLTPCKLEDFETPMNVIYTDEIKSNFLNNLFLFRYIELNTSPKCNEDFKFIVIFGTSILIGTKDQRFVENKDKFSEMIPILTKYFSDLGLDKIDYVVNCVLSELGPRAPRY